MYRFVSFGLIRLCESKSQIVFHMELSLFSLPEIIDVNFSLLYYSGETRVTTPTAIETQLPWKRDEDDAEGLQQNEFPAWSNNKEYLAYNSPSATFLGKFD